jgi:hypothetical protein
VQHESLDEAQKSYDHDKHALELGALPPLDIYRSESQVASQRVPVIQAEYALKQQEDQLRHDLPADINPNIRALDLDLTEKPDPDEALMNVDIPTALALADAEWVAQGNAHGVGRKAETEHLADGGAVRAGLEIAVGEDAVDCAGRVSTLESEVGLEAVVRHADVDVIARNLAHGFELGPVMEDLVAVCSRNFRWRLRTHSTSVQGATEIRLG